jgi:hypothetical protein
VHATARCPSTTIGEELKIRIRKNGSEIVGSFTASPRSDQWTFTVSHTFSVVPGDTVDVTFEHDSGSTRTITGASNLSYLTIEEVAC